MNKIARDNSINKINKRINTIAKKLGTNSELYKAFTDYFTVHGINTRQKNGVIQLVRGKKANVTIAQMNNIEMLDYYGKLKRDVSKRGEKATISNIGKAAWVKSNIKDIKEFVYLNTGQYYIDGLTGTKGKKTYSEMYKILKKYEKDYEKYKKSMYEDLEEF